MGIAITRVSGADRASTSVATMKLTRSINSCSDTVVIATGYNFADSLSISPYAYRMGTPIILTDKDGKALQLNICYYAARRLDSIAILMQEQLKAIGAEGILVMDVDKIII